MQLLLAMLKDTGVFQNTAQFLCISSNATDLVEVLQQYQWPLFTGPKNFNDLKP